METKAHYVAVGVFVVSCVLGGLIAILWLAGAQYREEFAYYRTYFSGGVTGLGTGTSVRYNGIEVGHVSKLDFDPDDPKRVIVTLQVSPSVPIHNDSVASIASEGLTGGSYVEIDGGSKQAPLLQPGSGSEMPVIRSKPSPFQQLEQSAPQLVAKLSRIADRVNDVLNDTNRRAIAEMLDHVRNVTALFDRHSADFDRTFGNLATASTTLNVDLTDIHGDLSDVHTVLANADQTTLKLNRLVDGLDAQLESAQIGQLVTDTRTLEHSLTNLSNEIEREPTSLIFGDRRKGYTPP
jgi:phospholipid/cholesterol/gamma-HCH transport system substrate-binding protein